MEILIDVKNKKYKDNEFINDADNYSHYHSEHKDTVIYLPQVLQHSLDCTIEQAFTQHVTHELIHLLLDKHIDYNTNAQFDNLGSKKMYQIEGKFSLRNWFGGMLDKEV